MDVRFEQRDDVPAIRKLLLDAFPTEVEADLVERLRSNGNLTVSLLAIEGDRIAGYVAFSPVTIDGKAGGLGIAPLAIHPEFQHRGVGGWLVTKGLESLGETQANYVTVLGYPEFYGKFGFRRASEFKIGNEYGVDDPFMIMELKPGSLPTKGGIARYGPEFGSLS